MEQIKILGISGSLRPDSTNTNIIKAISHLARRLNITVTLYEGLDQLPYFSPDLDGENAIPAPSVANLRKHLRDADAVIFSTPEYAFNIPGVLKNALDWIVSSGEFIDKPTAVISASPMNTGGDKANASLAQTLTVMSARITDATKLIIPIVRTKIDAAGNITDPSLQSALLALVQTLANAVNATS